jgi:hypothetical protein
MDGDEFEQQLHQLVANADENDVALLGCYDLRTGEADDRTLQLEITEVVSDPNPDYFREDDS